MNEGGSTNVIPHLTGSHREHEELTPKESKINNIFFYVASSIDPLTNDMMAHIDLLYKNSKLLRRKYSSPPITANRTTKAIVAE